MAPPISASNPPSPRGKRLFIAGCITLILFSVTHMIPVFAEMFIEPTDPVEIEAKRAMAAVVFDIGPFHTHFGKLTQLLSASYSVLLLFVAALNLVALPALIAHARLRAMAMVNVVFLGILLALALTYQFPPPGMFCFIAGIFFMGAMVSARPSIPQ